MARGEYSRQGALALLSLLEEVELREYGKLCRKVRESLDIPLDKLAWAGIAGAKSIGGFREGLGYAWGYPYDGSTAHFHDLGGLPVHPS